MFVRSAPNWVRVYELDKRGTPNLVGELRPSKSEGETCEYVEVVENVPGQSIRIYSYHLGTEEVTDRAARKRLT